MLRYIYLLRDFAKNNLLTLLRPLSRLLISSSLMLLLGVGNLCGQQLPLRTSFTSNSFVWNPAMAAPESYWEMSLTHRKEWTGFEDAPTTTMVTIQYPLLRHNTSLGGFFMNDNISPIKINSLGGTFTYKLELGRQRNILSLGILAVVNHFFVDGTDIQVLDAGDDLLPAAENTAFTPNVGFGIYYSTNPIAYQHKNLFYFGLAANQLIPSSLTFDNNNLTGSLADLKRTIHGNAMVGGRIYSRQEFIFEPVLWMNYAAENLFNVHLNLKIEKEGGFWVALDFASNQTLAFQIGTVFKKGLIQDGAIRMGLQGALNLGSLASVTGLGYEFYMAYRLGL